ncbi:hypothetical protein [Crassaminicella profunda]|uniref:hypothetical protein n=1 Tax=Crassaminicella profunda TaxID=1286698 RepID=UPI001CA6C36F|nr:hypothetical protein [Crassaminicella profunda]QZY54218.1 hypothetical protein K7H06_14360 [Crassaminicella profunda]
MPYKRWVKDEIDYLISKYNEKSIIAIADDLNRTKDSVFKKAKRLGLTTELKYWTEKELHFLIEKWGKKSVGFIAKELDRSVTSIRKKANELKLGPERIANGEFLTTGDIGYLLNKNPSLVYRWTRDGMIKGRRLGKKKVFQIRPNHFINFLKDHPNKWCANKARVNLIKPYFYYSNRSNVPEWFINKVENDVR